MSNQDMGDIGGGWQGVGCHPGFGPAERIRALAGLSARVAACLPLLRERSAFARGDSGWPLSRLRANRRGDENRLLG
jgi:hypothetical protein